MESISNFEEFETIEKTIFLLIYTAISFSAYLISIKGMYDVFPNLFKALGAFLVELAISIVLCIAMYGIFEATAVNLPTAFNPVMVLTIVVSMVIITFTRKVMLNYAAEIPTSILQAINSLVMHTFYIFILSFLILLVYTQIFQGSIDPSIFENS